ncbi:MAG: hypothetical protein HYY16_02140 [Planctomycetes bacterium]|nr:hypothetical protein [Planctomycetota bacterium]
MIRRGATTLALVATCAGVALAGGPPWMKWEIAKQMAAASGKPILVYCQVDEEGKGC